MHDASAGVVNGLLTALTLPQDCCAYRQTGLPVVRRIKGSSTLNKLRINLTKVPDYLGSLVRHGSVYNAPLFRNIPPSLRASVVKRVTYVRGQNFCYFRIPKSANSTVVMSLMSHMDDHPRLWPALPHGNSQAAADIAKRLLHGLPPLTLLPSLHTFTIVRHPASRVLSAFMQKSADPPMHPVYPYLAHSPATIEGFRYFLSALEDGAVHDDIHWAPQTDILPWDYRKYSFIGRMETLDADLATCLQAVFGRADGTRSARNHGTGSSGRAGSFLSAADRARIERLYAADYEAFYPAG